ncbi:DUF732 domain-containing protein [Mycobacterium shigaense]|uniref:DUF732 domain-containing protein n=1 Tax=Mycobacterium shigaense TaxID=722731 RepID=A0A1Z4EKX7_9MYCO|nr:DUF732 domain-containing protein [Mycobacterium shigaense]BAX93572.1 hypothetical protein MSG_03437 [Mycobacterium shigaense]
MPALMTYRFSTTWADVINAASAALRPLAVAAGVAAAGATLPALAHADTPNDPISSALTGAGVANNGSVSNAIAGIGRSICPSLVKPGATLASIVSKVSGNNGLSPNMAGLVTSMAIQMECPGFMTSLANGNMPFPLQAPGLPSIPGVGPAAMH